MKASISYLLLLLCLSLVNCKPTKKQDNQFTLNGKIIGQDTGTIIIRYVPDSTVVYDTLQIIKGEFVFKGTINEPLRADLNAGNDLNSAVMYIEPGVMNLVLTKDKFATFKLTGSKTQEENELLEKMEEPANKIILSLKEQYAKNNDLINNIPDEAIKKQLEKGNEEIEISIKNALNDKYGIWLGFAKSHPKSFLAPENLVMLEDRSYISFDSLKQIASTLDSLVINSKTGRRMMKYIRIKENTQIGAIAPDFKAVDSNDQSLTLSQFRGKNVVLIELWASWCGPCRQGFPFLKTLHRKYHQKGFEIIAIALGDIDKKTWMSAVKDEGIDNWYNLATQFRQGESLNNNILQNYPFGPIPQSFLIDKEGKIVGKWGFYSKADEDDLDKILDKLLINNTI
ncbi:MAG TPA: TlpA disulfide reductase family protein [Paludibacter sp.]